MMRPLHIPSGRFERLIANLIDSIVQYVAAGILFSFKGETDLAILAAFLLSAAYSIGFTSSRWQATPGKRLLNLYVVRNDGKRMTQEKAAERFLAFMLPSLPVYMSFLSENTAGMLFLWLNLAWFAPILYTDLRLGLHDRLCGTRVVVGKVNT